MCVTGLFCSAQNRTGEARREMSLYNYSNAAVILQGEVTKGNDQSKRESGLLLAECYRMLNDAANAEAWYEKTLGDSISGEGSMVEPVAWYYYAQSLRSCSRYREAKNIFLYYASLVADDRRGKEFAAFCDSAILWQALKPEFLIRNVKEVNSPQSEFGTVFYRHGILFASDREHESGKTYGWTGNNYLSLYFAGMPNRDSISGPFGKPQQAPEIAGQPWHDGPVSFNGDFTELFINRTQAAHDKGKKEHGHFRTHLLKIFTAKPEADKWSMPRPFFLNSDDYSVGHPALTPDGNTLYFVSDMDGGLGETDLYVCRREGGQWDEPVNLGAEINTPGKEMFPFVAANGDLYFASDGLPGFGGLDLFVTRKNGAKWATPRNLGQPVNSSWDDFSLAIAGSGQAGLFSSNRPGGAGSDDIYSFTRIIPAPDKPVSPPVASAGPEVKPPVMIADTMVANKPYRIENIFYDFDKWNIREDAKPSLDQLVALMKQYPLSIELASHTDCRGSESYNLELSQRRAESAVQYIISKGIDPARITAKGYGKSQPANKCNCSSGMDCTEAEHQFNRRTEFRIIHM